MSACAYVYDKRGEGVEGRAEQGAKSSNEWRMVRDRIRLGLGATKVLAGALEGAKGIEKELKAIARGVFANFSVGMENDRGNTPVVAGA
ncbi:hypothetical protein DID88_008946 [Monilinia fructigena]|uniref:Uncharacterized protein n=1 Tax=Monilinia fructigena TaxID=38457 RepID=A0A395J7Z3_9HELO|nr:hypothetical protein DID88_008946 [Monilinia fructigena]